MKYLINLTYDGSNFYGYQIQRKEKTVEGELEKVLSTILNEKVNTIASSRTDRYVHAINQYAHFETEKNIDIKKVLHSINSLIDKSIYIKSIKKVSDDFHSRYNVINKEYIYKINTGVYNPIEKNYVMQYNKKISKDILIKYTTIMSGKHNFKSFTSDNDASDYNRNVIITYKIEKNILYLTFNSSGFLRYMIRNIVGLLLDINDSKKSFDDINKIFESKSRTSCGRCAPGEGLYLNKIEFDKE